VHEGRGGSALNNPGKSEKRVAVATSAVRRRMRSWRRPTRTRICCYGNTSLEEPTCLAILKSNSSRSRCAGTNAQEKP